MGNDEAKFSSDINDYMNSNNNRERKDEAIHCCYTYFDVYFFFAFCLEKIRNLKIHKSYRIEM